MVEPQQISFGCTRCGACCNSPPRLSLPELFRWRNLFIGCLAVQRLNDRGDTERRDLFDKIGFRAPAPGSTHIAILAQGYGYESQARCPALGEDGGCKLHEAGKPLQCSAVPLDPMLPDRDQASVLHERMGDPAFRRGACLSGETGARRLLVSGSAIADADYVFAAARRRATLESDRILWARDMFQSLRHALAPPGAIPPFGYLALPLVPALLVVARYSPACRRACLDFLAAQTALIDDTVAKARARRREMDRPMTQRLLEWRDNYRDLATALQEPKEVHPLARRAEEWLGCTPVHA